MALSIVLEREQAKGIADTRNGYRSRTLSLFGSAIFSCGCRGIDRAPGRSCRC
jgi:hypothetical protein